MLYSHFIVMSFPFVNVVERNERQKKINIIPSNKSTPLVVNKESSVNSKENKPSVVTEKNVQNMVCLSNLEEIVFLTSSSRGSLYNMKSTPKPVVDYDKYLDFFE